MLDIPSWEKYLERVDNVDVDWVLRGLKQGFLLGTKPGPLTSAKRNCSSAFSQAQIIDSYLEEEIKEGTIAGPFSLPLFLMCRLTDLGLFQSLHPESFA